MTEHEKSKKEFPKGYFPPEDGWEENTWYLVDVSVKCGNPVHKSLLYTGFLSTKGEPLGYSGVIPINYVPQDMEDVRSYRSFRYLKSIRKLL